MFTATVERNAVQRSLCLFFSFFIVSAFLTIGAFGVESMVRNAEVAMLVAQAQA